MPEQSVNPVSVTADNMPDVWEQYKCLAYHVAMPYMRAYPSQTDDIMQECYLAMCDAVTAYNVNLCPFANFLPYFIRSHVGRYCRRNASAFSLPERTSTNRNKMSRARAILRDAGLDATERNVLLLSGVTSAEYHAAYSAGSALNASSLSDPVPGTDGVTVSDIIPDLQNNIDDAFERLAAADLHKNMDALVASLPDSDRTIVYQYYYEGKTLAEIGMEYGLSVNGVHTRIKKILQRMQRTAKRSHAFDEYLNDCSRSQSLRGGLNSYLHSWTSSTEKAAFRRIELSDNFKKAYSHDEKR